MRSILIVIIFQTIIWQDISAQEGDSTILTQAPTSYKQKPRYDVVDLFQDINPFGNKTDNDTISTKRSSIIYLPNINYNPSIGFQIGLKAVGGHHFGKESTTTMSTFATSINYTTRGIVYGYLQHDIFTRDNNWNFKGGLNIARMVALDYGIGVGNLPKSPSDDDIILSNADRTLFNINYTAYTFSQRIYKSLSPQLFAGAGIYAELKRNISSSTISKKSPNEIYNRQHGFAPTYNNNNGLMFNLQFTNRDNPNNAYSGIYTDIVFKTSQTWLGSSNHANILSTDFRKYWSLSSNHPNHVIAFWNYGIYLIGGKQPYIELPGTGRDTYSRTGRGYTQGYFKGNSFFYSELEYRYPILKNQFLSGVVFFNVQSVNDPMGTRLFQQWQPAGGTGLRILFNKTLRTNLCIDYAVGRFGQRGLFLGLNEAF